MSIPTDVSRFIAIAARPTKHGFIHRQRKNEMTYEEVTGSIFDNFHPGTPGTFLVHSCNCRGDWGAGIASEMARRYPGAYAQHRAYCKSVEPSTLIGTCQVIMPENIICLFTSISYGKDKCSPEWIATNTKRSLKHLFMGSFAEDTIRLISPRINSGLLGVSWNLSRGIIIDVCRRQEKKVMWTTYVK